MSGSRQYGYVGVTAECGYPPRVHPDTMGQWHEVHAGDVVLGVDGHEWRVTRRFGPSFTLARDGEQPVTGAPPLDADVTVVRRADTTHEMTACAALLGAGFTVELIEEEVIGDA